MQRACPMTTHDVSLANMSDPQIVPASTLNHKSVAAYLAEGLSIEQIATLTGLTIGGIQPIAENPLTQHMLKQLLGKKGEYRDENGQFDDEKALDVEREATFTKMVEFRDGDNPQVALAANKELYDRQRPKITKTEDERTVRIVLAQDQQDAARLAVQEVEAIDAEFTQIDEAGQA